MTNWGQMVSDFWADCMQRMAYDAQTCSRCVAVWPLILLAFAMSVEAACKHEQLGIEAVEVLNG